MGLNRLEEAESALEEALRVAQRQQAKAYELRAATSLARLWGEQGRRTEAREVPLTCFGRPCLSSTGTGGNRAFTLVCVHGSRQGVKM